MSEPNNNNNNDATYAGADPELVARAADFVLVRFPQIVTEAIDSVMTRSPELNTHDQKNYDALVENVKEHAGNMAAFGDRDFDTPDDKSWLHLFITIQARAIAEGEGILSLQKVDYRMQFGMPGSRGIVLRRRRLTGLGGRRTQSGYRPL